MISKFSTCILMLFCFFLLPISVSAAPSEQEINDSFNQVAKAHIEGYKTDPRVMVYFISGKISDTVKEGWRKSKCVITEPYSYVISKDEQDPTLYKAYLLYKMAILISPLAPSEKDAKAFSLEELKPHGSLNTIRITFSYKNGKWVPEKYEEAFYVLPTLPPTWLDLTQDVGQVHFRRLVVRDFEQT